MILTNKQIKEITDEEGVYDCRLITQQFAYKLFREEVSPYGSIVGFNSPVRVGALGIEEAFTVAVELPNVDSFGSVCFQRLYSAQLGTLLSVLTSRNYYVDGSSLFCDDLQASLTISNMIKQSGLFNIIFPITMYAHNSQFQLLDLEPQLFQDFNANVIESFNYLTKSIFIETCRDNF
jgi:hypothetical protein